MLNNFNRASEELHNAYAVDLLRWRGHAISRPTNLPVAMRIYRSLDLRRLLAAADDGPSTGLAVA